VGVPAKPAFHVEAASVRVPSHNILIKIVAARTRTISVRLFQLHSSIDEQFAIYTVHIAVSMLSWWINKLI
jgi:hypothetical protein